MLTKKIKITFEDEGKRNNIYLPIGFTMLYQTHKIKYIYIEEKKPNGINLKMRIHLYFICSFFIHNRKFFHFIYG